MKIIAKYIAILEPVTNISQGVFKTLKSLGIFREIAKNVRRQ